MNLIVDLDYFQRCQDYLSKCENIIGNVRSTVITQKNAMSDRALRSSGASYQIREVCERLEKNRQSVRMMRTVIGNIRQEYRETENKCKQLCGGVAIPVWVATNDQADKLITVGPRSDNETNNASSDIWDRVWDIIASGGPIGSTIGLIGALLTGGVTVKDTRFIPGIIGGFADAFDSGSSFNWKKLVGFEKWEMDKWDDLAVGSGKSVGKNISAVAKWAGYVLSLGFNAYDNFSGDREGDNNSFGRALAETLGETAVDIGADLLIGAGIAAGLAAIGAPAVAVGAVVVGGTVLVKWGLDGICNWIFEQDFSETVSDLYLDSRESFYKSTIEIAKGFGNAVEEIVNGGGNAFEEIVKGFGNAINTTGEILSGWWNRIIS